HRIGVLEDRDVVDLQCRQLAAAGGRAKLVAGAFAKERERAAVSGDHLVALDSFRAERLLDAAARMDARAFVIPVAHIEGRAAIGHSGPPAVGWCSVTVRWYRAGRIEVHRRTSLPAGVCIRCAPGWTSSSIRSRS